jgi:hypothetical protein
LPRREKRRIFKVWWVLAILCRSQHMCLFSESRGVMWVNVVNIGAVRRDLCQVLSASWLILCSNFFLVFTKCDLISSNRSIYAITIH